MKVAIVKNWFGKFIAAMRPSKEITAFYQDEAGAVLPFAVLIIVGGVIAVSFAVDTTRMVNSSAQLKRATDVAALAIGNIQLTNGNDDDVDLQKIASGYVLSNLGMDSGLINQIEAEQVTVTKGEVDGSPTYKVSVSLIAQSDLLKAGGQEQVIFSTVEVVSRPTEVALILPNSGTEDRGELAALRKVSKEFARNLLGDESAGVSPTQKVWLSLVPFSQSVNVYDESDPDRINRWAAFGELNPPELRSLFRTGKARSLADPRFPDRKANLLCVHRGLSAGQNFFWDQPPSGQFEIYYRHDLPENGSPGAPPISWVGPNPDFPDTQAEDTRWIVADKGCPDAALLPLTDNLAEIDARLDKMSTRFNVNYAIAMSWAGAALSPNMRGGAGWGNNELPLDFSLDGNNVKVIVMLVNTIGDWFDTDAYNFNDGETTNDSMAFARQRFSDLCRDFNSKNIKFFFIGVRPGDPEDWGRTLFADVAGPGLRECASGDGNFHFADASNFSEGQSQISSSLEKIADDIRRNYYAHLIE